MIFTAQQIAELVAVINRQHLVFIAAEVGASVLTDEDRKVLLNAGVDVNKLNPTGKIDMAFRFGMLAEAINDKRAKDMKYLEFKTLFEQGKLTPLTKAEEFALSTVRHQAYKDIKGLGNKIAGQFQDDLIEVDKKQRLAYEKIIEEELDEAILKRKTAKQMASALGHRTGDWARDFDRMSDFLMHTAFDQGKAQQILAEKGEDAEVYKQVYPNACNHCQRLYLTNGEGSKPIIFKLKTLMENGTNIGKKVADWKPVLGSTHPWCRCELYDVPAKLKWDEKDGGFTKVIRNTHGVKRKSKVKITINGAESK